MDDGGVCSINGVEVLRVNLPPRPQLPALQFKYRSKASVGRPEEVEYSSLFTVPPTVAVAGNNTIACEVHDGVRIPGSTLLCKSSPTKRS